MSLTLCGYIIPRVSRLLVAGAGALIALCVFASASQASSGPSGSGTARTTCSYPKATQVFSQWGDDAYYELAPDGGFEAGGTGWAFGSGAGLVSGNESMYLNGSADQSSLSLPYRGTATSPPFCVDANTPVFRFMALNSGDDHAKLRVTVTYALTQGTKSRITELRTGNSWTATEPLQLDTDGESERVARISFTPSEAGGQWLLDDVYIDPFARR
jgi:hypothetical protein